MEKTFEASLNELENIVRQLEEGDLPLEVSLKLFEDGVKLSRACRDRLDQAERRIEVLLKDADGNLVLEDMESGHSERRAQAGKRIVFDENDDEENAAF